MVEAEISLHCFLGLFCPSHDGALVILGGGQDAGTGEQEDGAKAKEREVGGKTAMLRKEVDALYQSGQTHKRDGQCHPTVTGVAAQVSPLPLGGLAQLQGQLRSLLQIIRRVL